MVKCKIYKYERPFINCKNYFVHSVNSDVKIMTACTQYTDFLFKKKSRDVYIFNILKYNMFIARSVIAGKKPGAQLAMTKHTQIVWLKKQ
jgi:hypothetical protein